jgi:uncharacterized DUF497 family protein
VEAALIFKGRVLSMIDNKKYYGEERKISIGEIENIIFIVVVHTCRDEKIRIISARRANKKERDKYYEYTKNIK